MSSRFLLIGLTGPSNSGKDTVGGLLQTHCGAHTLAFANALRGEIEMAYCIEPMFLTRRETKERPMSALALRRCLDNAFVGRMISLHAEKTRTAGGACEMLDLDAPRSPRQIMQWWGTEYRRDSGPDYWVKIAATHIAWLRKHLGVQCVVLTDVRFENEAALVRSMGGKIWQVKRPGTQHDAPGHASEVNGAQFAPDAVINNSYDIRHLQQMVLGAYAAEYWGVKSVSVEITP